MGCSVLNGAPTESELTEPPIGPTDPPGGPAVVPKDPPLPPELFVSLAIPGHLLSLLLFLIRI